MLARLAIDGWECRCQPWNPAAEHASFTAERDEVKFRVDVDGKVGVIYITILIRRID